MRNVALKYTITLRVCSLFLSRIPLFKLYAKSAILKDVIELVALYILSRRQYHYLHLTRLLRVNFIGYRYRSVLPSLLIDIQRFYFIQLCLFLHVLIAWDSFKIQFGRLDASYHCRIGHDHGRESLAIAMWVVLNLQMLILITLIFYLFIAVEHFEALFRWILQLPILKWNDDLLQDRMVLIRS